MSNVIVPGVLTVSDVVKLPAQFLKELSMISTDVVVIKINKWVSNNLTAILPDNKLAAEKLSAAFQEVNDISNYLNSEDARNIAAKINMLSYSDVSAYTDVHTLKTYRTIINSILAYDGDITTVDVDKEFIGKLTASRKVLDDNNLQMHLVRMRNIIATEDVKSCIDNVISAIESHDYIFKNGSYGNNMYNVFKYITQKKDKLTIIKDGLDFLIPKLEAGISPQVWRVL